MASKLSLDNRIRSDLVRQIKNQVPACSSYCMAYEIIRILTPYDIKDDEPLLRIYRNCCNILSKTASNDDVTNLSSSTLVQVNSLELTTDFVQLYHHKHFNRYDEIKNLYITLADQDFSNFCHSLIDLIINKDLSDGDSLISYLLDWAITYTDGRITTGVDPSIAEKLLRTIIPAL